MKDAAAMAWDREEQDIEELLEEIPRIRHLDEYYGGDADDSRICDEILYGLCNRCLSPWCEVASCSDWSSSSSRSRSGPSSPSSVECARRSADFREMGDEALLVENLLNVRLGVDRKEPVCSPASVIHNSPIGVYNNRLVNWGSEAFFNPFGRDSLINWNGNPCPPPLQQHFSGSANLVDPLLRKSSYGAAELGAGRLPMADPRYWRNTSGYSTSFLNEPYPISDALLQSEMTTIAPCWGLNAPDALKLPNNSAKITVNVGHQSVPTVRNMPDAGSARGTMLHCPRNQRNAHGTSVKRPSIFLMHENLMGVKEHLYNLAKDQHGCRYLQQRLDEGKHQADMIFNGLISHTVELMVDPFGNYLMQKLLEKCNEEQLMEILLVLNKNSANLVGISLNIHGTRAVQKLIETVKTKRHISLVTSALRVGFLNLVKDLNGSHVLQRCLETFTPEDNKFIFEAAAMYCVDIATHRHGCCVLQKCINDFTGKYQQKLVAVVAANGFELAQDPYGNYVVQAVLELEEPFALAILASQFKGRYVELSAQKFSSNVVESCFSFFGKDFPATFINELLSSPHFDKLLQHPYANYPIQRALEYSEGSCHAALDRAIRPFASTLRTNPHCRQIYSKLLSKK